MVYGSDLFLVGPTGCTSKCVTLYQHVHNCLSGCMCARDSILVGQSLLVSTWNLVSLCVSRRLNMVQEGVWEASMGVLVFGDCVFDTGAVCVFCF